MLNRVFISYSVTDQAEASAIVAKLEHAGIPCWFAPRDILPGRSWGEAVMDGINDSRLMILIFSKHANASPHVVREVERAIHRRIQVLPVRLDDVVPSGALELYTALSQWLDAFAPPFEQHLDRILTTVLQHLGPSGELPREEAKAEPSAVVPVPPTKQANAAASSFRIRHRSALRAGVAVLGIAGFGAIAIPALWSEATTSRAPRLNIAPFAGEPMVGDTFHLTARIDARQVGEQQPARWRSSDSTIARLLDSRQSEHEPAHVEAAFHAVGPGTAFLHAEAASARDSVELTVRQPVIAAVRIAAPDSVRVGESVTLSALAEDSSGRAFPLTRLVWSSSAPRIASVDSGTGVLRAIAPGRARVSALAGSVASSIEVVVESAPPRTRPQNETRSGGDPQRSDSTAAPPLRPETRSPSEDDMHALAEQCARALRSSDKTWLTNHYSPITETDRRNLQQLTSLFDRSEYQVASSEVMSVDLANVTVDFRVRFRYRTSFGGYRNIDSVMRGSGASERSGWELTTCRVRGTLDLP